MGTLITGGTGNVGLPLLDALSGRAGVRALVIGDDDARRARERDVEPVRGRLDDPDSLAAAFTGVERLFLLTPFVAGQEQLEHAALDAAEAAGVDHVVKLAYAGLDWPIAITEAHRRIRDRLDRGPVASTLLLADVYATNLLGQADLLRDGRLVLPGPGARIAYVDPADVGQVAASVVTATSPPQGQVVVTGPDLLTNEEVAAIAGRAFRGSPAAYVAVEPRPFADSLVQGGWPVFVADAVAEMHATIAARGPLPVTDTVRAHLGRDATPLAIFLDRAVA